MNKLFALLVGINNYHPKSGVTGLNGCVNDVNNIDRYLQKRFTAENRSVIKLTNAMATRENVIGNFITHLINNKNIKKDDTVLFYYSGHGSYSQSNPAFKKFDPQGRDETLVLYDSRCPGNFDLADKEIALLIHAVSKEVNIVLVIDSCHSGSITRNLERVDALKLGKAKHTPALTSDHGRKLADYLSVADLSYKQMSTEDRLEIPYTRHAVLSACSRGEVAYENSNEPTALFTSQLLIALENSSVNLSYVQLNDYLYTLLARYSRKQTPELSVFEGFDARTEFLGNQIKNSENVFSVTRDVYSNNWTINCGAIHGLNDSRMSKGKAGALIQTNDKTISVPIVSVGLNKSDLGPLQLTHNIYKATVVNLPPVVVILVVGDDGDIKSWNEVALKRASNQRILFVTASMGGKVDYLLQISQAITIHRTDEAKTLVHGIQGKSEKEMEYMHQICSQIFDWNKLLQLENHQMTEADFRNEFQTDFSISLTGFKSEGPRLIKDEIDVVFDQPLVGTIDLRNHNDKSYFVALYYLSDDFGITRVTKDNPNTAILSKDRTPEFVRNSFRMELPDGMPYDIDRYKLIISKTPFVDHEIPAHQPIKNEIVDRVDDRTKRAAFFGEERIDQTWYAKMITVRLLKSSGTIDAQHSCSLGKITFTAHPSFSATAGINSIRKDSKDVHPSLLLQEIVEANGHSLVVLDPTKKGINPSEVVVTLSEFDNEQNLKDNPLILHLHQLQNHGKEEIIALTLQDGILVPLGTAVPLNENDSLISINSLPTNQNIPDGENKKNFVRAVWFCLVKVVLRKNPSRLRWIDFAADSKYVQTGLSEKVRESGKILLVVHGIIGNTEGQVASMKYLFPQSYDLILAYDYENLNTGIEKIAVDLFDKLKNAGIDGKTKTINIVAHSMGGLVSRYLIEHVKGTDGWVNKLYMFGTPNGGSAFGNISKWQDRLIGLLTLACNVGKSFLGGLGPFLEALNKGLGATKVATNTLGQMRPGSDFYELLNKKAENDVKTKYFVIAGNIQDYKAPDGPWFNKLIENIELKIGKVVYSESPNDIAVAVSSILDVKHIPVIKSETVPCHHLNYFEADASMNCFKELEL